MTDNGIQMNPNINIGIATALEDRWVVPVLVHADRKNWDELSAAAKQLAIEARKGKLFGAGKGTFTVSNIGMYGVDAFTAVINPPESAILAVGAVSDQVIAIHGTIGIAPMMIVTLCCNHRIIDGSVAAQFLKTAKIILKRK